MDFRFNLDKTIQAVALLVKLDRGTDAGDYLRILKELYVADRESIKRYNRPITGDRIVAMDHGPVLSNVLNLINGDNGYGEHWASFLGTRGHDLVVLQDPGEGDLCAAETEILRSVAAKFAGMKPWDVVNWTHQLPEWRNNFQQGTSTLIPLEDIMESVGRAGEADSVRAESSYLAMVDNLIRSLEA